MNKKNRLKIILSALFVFVSILSFPGFSSSATILFPPQGGTGIGSASGGDVGKFLKVTGNSPLTYGFSTAGSSSPLTTKGDIYVYSTTDDRLAVGSNGKVLSADSSAATGLKWITLTGGGDMASGTYDPAGIGEQLVGLTATQTLTNKTLTSPKINENVALTTTATKLNYLTSATGTTGTASTNIVFSTSPTLTTPVLGVAAATSINKITITTPATGSTLTLIDGKTLTINKTMSFTAADDTGVYTLPTGTKTLLATDGAGTALTGIPYTITGTANQVIASAGTGNITLSLPQSIATSSGPQFATIELGAASDTTIARSGAGDLTIEGNGIYRAGGTDVAFADGGTGISSWTQYLIPYAATTTSIGQIAIGTSGQVLTSNGAGAAPTFQSVAGSGTVTASGGSLTSNAVVLGAGTTDTKVSTGITTDGTAKLVLGVNTTTIGTLKMFGNTSGDATITPTAVAGTATVWTLPASSDTFVGKATTDELTNKTLTASVAKGIWTTSGTWTVPSFTLNGTINGAGGNIINATIGASNSLPGTFTVLTASTNALPLIVANTTDATSNQVSKFSGVNATRANNDLIYQSYFLANSAGTQKEFGRVNIKAPVVTNTSEDGSFIWSVMNAGTLTDTMTLTKSSLSIGTSNVFTTGTVELGAASDTTLARSGAGAMTVEGVNVLLNGGALGTPSSGTLTNASGLPISGLTASTSTAIGVGSVELGHATDTTIARVSAGLASVEGQTIDTASNTLTLTNKTLTSPVLTTPSAFTTGGTITLAENTSIALPSFGSLSADGKYSGIVEVVTAGETVAFGDIVYLKTADSQWYLADADADSTAGAVRIAIAVTAGTDNNTMTVMTYGKIRADANFPTLTVGAPVYVSTTPGDVQTAQPSGTDDVIRIGGYGNSGDELFFNPSNDYMTHT